jgi:hypothetical protein
MWHEASKYLGLLSQGITDIVPSSDTATSVSGTATVSTSGPNLPFDNSLSQNPKYIDAWKNYSRVVFGPTLKDELRTLLKTFNLDRPIEEKNSPLVLFENAYITYENPPSGQTSAASSLIPMREAIGSSLEELIKRLTDQQPSGNDRKKIIVICSQIRKSGIPDTLVAEWANQWHEINDELSESKTAILIREEWTRRLNRATLFLQTFLSGLNPNLLKRKQD